MQSNLGWLKKFGPAQNILGPVKGQVINLCVPGEAIFVEIGAEFFSEM